jgi:hypothetical protein
VIIFALPVTPFGSQNNRIFLQSHHSNDQLEPIPRHVAYHWRGRLATATVDLLPP